MELRILLDLRIGGPGQYSNRTKNPNTFYLPRAGELCRVVLTFGAKRIIGIAPGPAFDAAEWKRISREIDESIVVGPTKVGRAFCFSGNPVSGSWSGHRSGVQIHPPPGDAPRAPVLNADHPFILEFPLVASGISQIQSYRWSREHGKLTRLLNVLLVRGTASPRRRQRHFWACVHRDGDPFHVEWVGEFFFAKLGETVVEALTPPAAEQVQELDPADYYGIEGLAGDSLRVPTDLDEMISCHRALSKQNAEKFDRAAYWFDLASQQWHTSVSASFAALVSAAEALTQRGEIHRFECPVCHGPCQHELPGATENFRAFFEAYAAGAGLKKRRSKMYSLRSGILHGSDLMQIDQDRDFGWDPPTEDERELHDELWSLTRTALRNWLKNPPGSACKTPRS